MSKFHTNQLAGFPEKSGRWQMQVSKGLRGTVSRTGPAPSTGVECKPESAAFSGHNIDGRAGKQKNYPL